MPLCLKSISGVSGTCCLGAAHFLSSEVVVGQQAVCFSVLAQLSYLHPDSIWEPFSGNKVYIQAGNLKGIEINVMI